MPGSYYTELVPGDITGPANYDAGIFATTGGMLGRYNDGGGVAVAEWVSKNLPDFQPKRILDIGAGLGHNVLPIAAAFPDADVIAVDAGEITDKGYINQRATLRRRAHAVAAVDRDPPADEVIVSG